MNTVTQSDNPLETTRSSSDHPHFVRESSTQYQVSPELAPDRSQETAQLPVLLEALEVFENTGAADRVELIRRYAERRAQVRKQVEFVGARELGEILGEQKANWSRDLNNLRSKGKILAVKQMGANNWEYPVNQLDPVQGDVYPVLKQHIPALKASGLSDWDILLWLYTPTHLVQPVEPVALPEEESLAALLESFEQTDWVEQPLVPAKPIHLLEQRRFEHFSALAEQLANALPEG